MACQALEKHSLCWHQSPQRKRYYLLALRTIVGQLVSFQFQTLLIWLVFWKYRCIIVIEALNKLYVNIRRSHRKSLYKLSLRKARHQLKTIMATSQFPYDVA
jgi:hypothetical protein